MSDLDKFRQDLIDAIDIERKNKHLFNTAEDGLLEARRIVNTLPFKESEQDREFIKLTVRNLNGRPYYSIIYLEVDDNGVGHDFEGYSSYSLDVISDYLKKYFISYVESEYEPVNLEEFAKVMSQSTIYSFMTWHREALELMNRHGFVICKKTI